MGALASPPAPLRTPLAPLAIFFSSRGSNRSSPTALSQRLFPNGSSRNGSAPDHDVRMGEALLKEVYSYYYKL